MEIHKVALIHNIIAPYRIPFFVGLTKHPHIDLFVYYCSETEKMREWNIPKSEEYNYEILSGKTLNFLNLVIHINPSVINRLIKGNYDVVIINGTPSFTTYFAYFTCRLLKIPIVWWTEGIESSQSILGKIISPFVKHILKNVNSVVVPGTLARDFQIKLGVDFDKIFIAPNIVDNDRYFIECSKYKPRKRELKSDLNLQGYKIILFVGRLVEEKGLFYLIEAYGKLKKNNHDICLIIIGSGILKSKLSQFCIQENIKDVIFTGWLSDEKIMYYSVADLFVLPTLRDVWGLVINEAMACELPVISTNVAGASIDMIKPGKNGYIIDAANVDQLVWAIHHTLFECNLSNMGKESLKILEEGFSVDNMVKGFVSAIEYSLNNN